MSSPVVNLRRDDFRTDTVMGVDDLIETLHPGLSESERNEIDEIEFHAVGVKFNGKEMNGE